MEHCDLILYNLLNNNDYTQATIPYIKEEYFSNLADKVLFIYISKFIEKYSSLPTLGFLKLEIEKNKSLNENQFSEVVDKISFLENFKKENWDYDWLIDETEFYCQTCAIENAVMESFDIINDDSRKKERTGIVDKMRDALAIDFKSNLGIEFFDPDCIDKRWENYLIKAERFKCKIDKINETLGGGFIKKTLNILLASTHVGKTACMCSMAKDNIELGYNVLYVTCEMSEEMISQRQEANYLDVDINDIVDVDEKKFKDELKKIATKSGSLWIKEFATSSITVNHIRAYLAELKLKKNFVPDIIYVDYLNLLLSSRYKSSGSYEIIKGVTEELRGLSVTGNYCIITATQTNRSAYESSKISMTDTSESWGVPQTADTMFALLSSEELQEQNIVIAACLKNRLSGIIGNKFPISVEFSKARFINYNSGNSSGSPQEMMQKYIPKNNMSTSLKMKKAEMKPVKRKLKVSLTQKDKDDVNAMFGN